MNEHNGTRVLFQNNNPPPSVRSAAYAKGQCVVLYAKNGCVLRLYADMCCMHIFLELAQSTEPTYVLIYKYMVQSIKIQDNSMKLSNHRVEEKQISRTYRKISFPNNNCNKKNHK